MLTDLLKSVDSYVCIPKQVTTHWSCRADASKVLVRGYPQIRDVLAKIGDDPDEVPEVRCEATGLHEGMCIQETDIYSVFWHEILDRVNGTNKQLQDPKLDLNAAVATVKPLKSFADTKRECFNEYNTCRLHADSPASKEHAAESTR